MQSKATTIQQYIDELPEERRKVVAAMRKAIRKNIPKGFEEVMSYGMIGYVVPHKIYPDGYHVNPKLPLPFMNVASQKNHIALYHMGLAKDGLLEWFEDQWSEVSGKAQKLEKGCIRFKKPEDVPVELIGELASKITPLQWIKIYEGTRESTIKKLKTKKK